MDLELKRLLHKAGLNPGERGEYEIVCESEYHWHKAAERVKEKLDKMKEYKPTSISILYDPELKLRTMCVLVEKKR